MRCRCDEYNLAPYREDMQPHVLRTIMVIGMILVAIDKLTLPGRSKEAGEASK